MDQEQSRPSQCPCYRDLMFINQGANLSTLIAPASLIAQPVLLIVGMRLGLGIATVLDGWRAHLFVRVFCKEESPSNDACEQDRKDYDGYRPAPAFRVLRHTTPPEAGTDYRKAKPMFDLSNICVESGNGEPRAPLNGATMASGCLAGGQAEPPGRHPACQ